ncbi:ABC transporter ATP-binding protein [Calidifontibacter terrae]
MSLSVDGSVTRGSFNAEFRLEVPPGTTAAVLGPNGTGKTTLLRAIAGLTPLSSGSVEVDGNRWQTGGSSLPTHRRSVGLMLAAPTLFPRMSVADNIAYGPRSRGVSATAARSRALSELDAVGLADRAGDRPASLSSGQAARVALARALATDPSVLLLDEPLAAIDPETRATVRAGLAQRLSQFEGYTLLVTHDPLDALTLADHIQLMEAGTLSPPQTPAQIVARPMSSYAARLVGLNLLPGVGSERGVLVDGRPIFVTSIDRGPLWVAIRPAAVSLWPQQPAGSPRNTWACTVTRVELVGQTMRIGLDAGFPMVAEVTVGALNDLGLQVGSSVWATVKATEIDTYPRSAPAAGKPADTPLLG